MGIQEVVVVYRRGWGKQEVWGIQEGAVGIRRGGVYI